MNDVDEVRALGRLVSNWGRWGNDDERGTLNLITPDHVRDAASAARSGRVFDLSIPIGPDLPLWPKANRRPPPVHTMTVLPEASHPDMVGADDSISMPLQISTQWDGLAHVGYDGLLYNGVPVTAVTALGATRNSIAATAPGAVGGAVLLDVAGAMGVEWLPGGHSVTPEELEEAERRQGVRVAAGDILLVRTGWRRKSLVEGWDGWLAEEPGLGLACATWLHERDVAAVACDNHAVEVTPTDPEQLEYPLHCVLIRDMGMPLGEMFDLEALAADCQADGRWRFLLSAPPLRVDGAVGAPTSPIAIK